MIVERHHRSLLAAEAEVASIELEIGLLGQLPMDLAGVGQPESGEETPPGANGTADANLPQPGAPLRWIAQCRPRAPGQFHRFLNGVLGFLWVSQDGIGYGEKPAALRVNSGLKP